MTIQAALHLVNDLIARAAVEEADMTHVVLAFDPETGYITATGPYDDGRHAVIAAEVWQRELNSANEPDDSAFRTIAITCGPPVDTEGGP